MDLQSALVCVVVFLLSGALLLLISMFGMREKSYEEAIAEQRQKTGGLLGTGNRQKSKEKKLKKAGKKVKEKQATAAVETNDAADEKAASEVVAVQEAPPQLIAMSIPPKQTSHSHAKLHVGFEEPAAVEVSAPNVKKRTKKDKVKPILLNKEKSPVKEVTSSKSSAANHFEKIHPKDEFELLHSHHKEELPVKQEKPEVEEKKTKNAKSKVVEKDVHEQPPQQKASKGGNKEKKQQQQQQQLQKEQQKPVAVEEPVVVKVQPAMVKVQPGMVKVQPAMVKVQPAMAKVQPGIVKVQPAMVKVQPAVVKSAPTNVHHQNNIINNHNTANSVKDKKKKKSEFNTLQQLTASDKHDVNVSHLVPLVRKADLSRSEIQILIDLLLNKQHEAPAIIDEWTEGRTDPVQKLKRQLADKERALTEEQEALVGAQAKLRELRVELNSERSRLLHNCRTLEESLHAKHSELQGASTRMHTQNQKIQQMQAQINDDMIASHKLHQELNSLQVQRQQLDLHLSQKQEAETAFQSQLNQLRSELQDQQNINTQLNMDLRSWHADKEMYQERVRQIEREAVQYKKESDHRQKLQRQLEDYGKMLQQQVSTLEADKTQLEVEKAQLEAANNAAAEDRNKEIEILNLQNELASLRVRYQQRESQLTSELEEAKHSVEVADTELQTQRNKNDELRKKNWKVMEALNVAETSLRTKQKQTITINDDESLKKMKKDHEANSRKFLQRLFPDVELSNSDNWMAEAEDAIRKYVSELQEREQEEDNTSTTASVDVDRLQEQVLNYRNIIDDTEGMLNKLQSHVEREEINWRKQIQSKDAEIESLKEQNRIQSPHCICKYKSVEVGNNSPTDEHGVKFAFSCIERSLPLIAEELQTKISELKEKLSIEQQAKLELETECEALRERLSSAVSAPTKHAKHTQFKSDDAQCDRSLADVEQIVEEKTRLAAELVNEQKRCQELTEEVLRLRSNDVSVPLKVMQNHTSNGTSVESADATVSN